MVSIYKKRGAAKDMTTPLKKAADPKGDGLLMLESIEKVTTPRG
jgi:hypothetical protein